MLLESFSQDLRVGARVLVKEKSFCALAVGVLALGICAVTTQFAVVNGVLLRGLAFSNPHELVDVLLVNPVDFKPADFNAHLTTTDFVELKERQTSFAGFTAYLNGSTVNVTFNGAPQRYTGGYITHDFFRVLGVKPALGRDFLPEDDRPGAEKAVILSDKLWKRDFGGEAHVLGQPVRVNGRAGTIVGVMPPRFTFPANEELWIPVNTEFPPRARNDRAIQSVNIIARLKPGVSLAQANREVTALAQHFARAYPENKAFTLGWVRPLLDSFTGPQLSGTLYTMLAFCAGVLVIACVNVMNMQLARATLRAKELAIRSSLGATRTRLLRQMLTESLLVATLGATLGVGLSMWTTDWLDAAIRNVAQPPPAWMVFTLDGPVLAFTVAATMLSAVLAGLLPAWIASRADAVAVLKESGRGNTGSVVRSATRLLVIVQIVVTCVLLIGSLLQVQSIVRQQHIDYGFDPGAILSARLGLMEGDYPTNEKKQVFYERLLRELRASPQFAAVAFTNRFRMVFSGGGSIEIEGRDYPQDSDRPNVRFETVSPGYFDVLGVKLREGRDFTDDDADPRQPLAIVNAVFAEKHFNHQSPLGRRFRTIAQNGSNPGPWRTIVGVVPQVRMQGPFTSPSDGAGFYLPFTSTVFGPVAEQKIGQQFGTAIVRPRGGQRPEAVASALQAAVHQIDPNLPLYFVATPKTHLDDVLGQVRVVAVMFSVFGLVAVVLASVGLYGVTSFAVTQRTQEFGIRMALGADRAAILLMVLRQAVWQIAIGLVAGLALALLIAVLAEDGLSRVLFQISARDPLTYATVSVLLAAVALLATFVPARRATKVDPMTALRAD